MVFKSKFQRELEKLSDKEKACIVARIESIRQRQKEKELIGLVIKKKKKKKKKGMNTRHLIKKGFFTLLR